MFTKRTHLRLACGWKCFGMSGGVGGETVMNLRGEERKAGGLDWSYVTTNLNTPGKSARFEGSHSFIHSL